MRLSISILCIAVFFAFSSPVATTSAMCLVTNESSSPCMSAPDILVETIMPEICDDGIDNDGDGLIDCFDPDCNGNTLCGDADNDGITDAIDIDDDNDGLLDSEECAMLGTELVQNGDFENGYADWRSDFNRGSNNNGPTSGGCSIQGWIAITPCATINGECTPYFRYDGGTFDGSVLIVDPLGTGANMISTSNCNNMTGSCLAQVLPDNTTGTGLSLYVDPNNIVGQAYIKQEVAVTANTFYIFSAWIMVIEEDPSLKFRIGGVDITSAINLDRQTGGTNGPDVWQEVKTIWFSGSTGGTVEIALVNLTAGCVGNDIRVDDVSLRQINITDSDGDGTADCFDLDSDNDGCSDVLEAGFTDNDDDGYLGSSPITVDVTGAVTSGSDGYTGTNPFVTNAGQQMGCPDADNDLLSDANDLDDDNDGILDLDECNGTFMLDGAHTTTTFTTTEVNTTYNGINYNLTTSNGVTFNTSIGPNLNNFSGGPPSPYNGSQTHLYLEIATDINVDMHGTLKITFPAAVVDPTIYFSDLSSGITSPNWSLEFILQTAGMTPLIDYTDGELTLIGDTIRGTVVTTTNASGLVRFSGTTSELVFKLGHYSPTGQDGPVKFGINMGYTECSDVDNDNVDSRFDLDSDNDGIFDCVEAGHGQSFSNGRLIGGVDAQGIPLTVSDGSGGINYSYTNSDGTGVFDPFALDSDNDGCNDVLEAGYTDPDLDGLLGPRPLTVDPVTGLVTSGGP